MRVLRRTCAFVVWQIPFHALDYCSEPSAAAPKVNEEKIDASQVDRLTASALPSPPSRSTCGHRDSLDIEATVSRRAPP